MGETTAVPIVGKGFRMSHLKASPCTLRTRPAALQLPVVRGVLLACPIKMVRLAHHFVVATCATAQSGRRPRF